jgi:hypothetical protein
VLLVWDCLYCYVVCTGVTRIPSSSVVYFQLVAAVGSLSHELDVSKYGPFQSSDDRLIFFENCNSMLLQIAAQRESHKEVTEGQKQGSTQDV